MSNLSFIDIVVIAAYFLVLAAIAWWAAKREKNISSDFFLASRDVGWLAVGASLFASNIGSEHLVGLAGTGAASGLAVGHFEWLASFILLLLGWLFVPFYLRSAVYTMPEFLERRYNPESRSYFTWVSIVGYVLTKISVTLFAGGIVMRAVTGFDFWTSAAILRPTSSPCGSHPITRISHGRASSLVRRFSAFGIGVPTSTSSSACLPLATLRKPVAERSSPAI